MAASRREARERALEILYEREMKGGSVAALLADLPLAPDALSVAIAEGVEREQQELDRLIEAHLREDWRIDRLAVVDLLALRIGSWELLHGDAPRAVVLSEAVALAKHYGGEDSGRFVNGVLAAIDRER